jgi:Interferon-induced transmembrane protein
MFCRQCGQQNADNNYRCVNCGYLLHSAPAPLVGGELVQNYLVFAILSLAFSMLCAACYCFPIGVPFAIPAVIYSAQVNGRVGSGDLPGARESSKKAQMWCWISVGVSLAGLALYLVFIAVMAVLGAKNKH